MALYGVTVERNIYGSRPLSFQSDVDIENGMFIQRGTLVANEQDVIQATQPATATLGNRVYIVSHPAWSYYTQPASINNPENFINAAGIAFRAYDLEPNNEFDITAYSFDGTPAVGSLVVAQDGSYKPAIVAAGTDVSTYGFVAVIEQVYSQGYFVPIGANGVLDTTGLGSGIDGRYNFVRFRVIKNGDATIA